MNRTAPMRRSRQTKHSAARFLWTQKENAWQWGIRKWLTWRVLDTTVRGLLALAGGAAIWGIAWLLMHAFGD